MLSTDFGAGTTTESGRVAQQLDDLAETGGQIAIVADDIDVDDPQVQRDLTAGLAQIAALDGVLDVADPWSTGADALRATDGRAALVVVTLAGDLERGRRARRSPSTSKTWPTSSTPPRSSSAATCWSARPSPPPRSATS